MTELSRCVLRGRRHPNRLFFAVNYIFFHTAGTNKRFKYAVSNLQVLNQVGGFPSVYEMMHPDITGWRKMQFSLSEGGQEGIFPRQIYTPRVAPSLERRGRRLI